MMHSLQLPATGTLDEVSASMARLCFTDDLVRFFDHIEFYGGSSDQFTASQRKALASYSGPVTVFALNGGYHVHSEFHDLVIAAAHAASKFNLMVVAAWSWFEVGFYIATVPAPFIFGQVQVEHSTGGHVFDIGAGHLTCIEPGQAAHSWSIELPGHVEPPFVCRATQA